MVVKRSCTISLGAIAAFLAQLSIAEAQYPGQIPDQTVIGNISGAKAPAAPVSISEFGFTPASVTGYYYSAQTQPSNITGSALAPSIDPVAGLAVEKFFDTSVAGYPSGLPWQHPTFYSVCHLIAVGADTQNNACRGVLAEAIDTVGGFGTFVEGLKGVGVSTSTSGIGGGAYGGVLWAQSYNAQYTIGGESQTIRTNGPNAPGPRLFNPSAQMLVGFLHSNGIGAIGNRADVGFLINPFNQVKTSTGFGCGENTIESTAGVCFGDWGGSAIGLDLSLGGAATAQHTLASILISNVDPIKFWNTDGVTVETGMFFGADNLLHLSKTSGTAQADGNFNVVGDLLVGGGNITVFNTAKGVSAVSHIVRQAAAPLLVANSWTLWTNSATGELTASLGSAPFTVKVLAP